MSQPRIEKRFINFGADKALYIFPAGAPSDGGPNTQERQLAFNPDSSIYVFPPEAQQPGGGPPAGPVPGVEYRDMPNPGSSTFLDFEAGVTYAYRVPPGN